MYIVYFVHMYLASSDWQKSTMVMYKLINTLGIYRYMYVLPVTLQWFTTFTVVFTAHTP